MRLKINKKILKKAFIVSLIVSVAFILWDIATAPRILSGNFWIFLFVGWVYFVNPFLPLFISSYFGLSVLSSKNKKRIFWVMSLVSIAVFILIMLTLGLILKFGPNWKDYVFGRFAYAAFVIHLSVLYYRIPITGLNFLLFSPILLIITTSIVAFVLYYLSRNKKLIKTKRK